MAFFDLSPEALESYLPDVAEPEDLDQFWADTFAEHGSGDLEFTEEPVDHFFKVIDVRSITWRGYGGHTIRGWLLLPKGHEGRLPTVVQYSGYSGGRSFPAQRMFFASAGYAHFVIDARGQGWGLGANHPGTDDPAARHSGDQPGFMTSGILDPADYYYRRLYVDAVRLAEAAAQHDRVDPDRLFVGGTSQGGGLSIAVAGLAPSRGLKLAGCNADVPFLANFPRAVGLTDGYPYKEIADYLAIYPQHRAAAMRTLSYFDVASLGHRAEIPAIFSVGLMDPITPPSTVYAAYNHYAGEDKTIEVYPFNGHEGGGGYQVERVMSWLAERT